MIKLLSIILFCMFPLIALSQEGAQKAPDDEAAAEEVAVEEEKVYKEKSPLSAEEKAYNYCVMGIAVYIINPTRQCVSILVNKFALEHGQEQLNQASISDIGAPCFKQGVESIVSALEEDCKPTAAEEEAAAEGATK